MQIVPKLKVSFVYQNCRILAIVRHGSCLLVSEPYEKYYWFLEIMANPIYCGQSFTLQAFDILRVSQFSCFYRYETGITGLFKLWIAQWQIYKISAYRRLWTSCLMVEFGRTENLLDVLTKYEILWFCRLDQDPL